MNYLEKILFIDLTCYQLGITDTSHPDFIAKLDSFSDEEKNQYAKLTNEIHRIWTYINMPPMVNVKKRGNSVSEYNETIHPVDKRILTICSDYGITLNEEFKDEFKATAKRLLGKDYFNWFEK